MASLGQRAKIGVMWSLIQNIGGRAITFVVFFVLARLLNAEDFGLVALALVVITFLDVFVGLGFGDAIVQRADLRSEHLDSVFWLSLLVGFLASLAMFSCRDVLASVMGNVNLSLVLGGLSLCPLINSLNVVQNAVLRRNLMYKQLAVRTTVSNFLSGIVGVVCAFADFGVFSLVAQQLTYAATAVFFTWYLSKWRPRAYFDFRSLKELFGFGVYVTATQLLDVFFTKTAELLIGIFMGPVLLGFYSVGNRLIQVVSQVFLSSVLDVAKGVFSKLQSDAELLRSSYVKFLQTSSLVCLPAFTMMALMADDLTVVVFGEKWLQSAPILRAGAFLACIQTVQYFAGIHTTAIGYPRVSLIVNLLKISISLLLFGFTYKLGIEYVAWAMALAGLIVAPVSFVIQSKLSPIKFYDNVVAIFPAVLASAGISCGVLVVDNYFGYGLSGFISIVLNCSVSFVIYSLIIYSVIPAVRCKVNIFIFNMFSR